MSSQEYSDESDNNWSTNDSGVDGSTGAGKHDSFIVRYCLFVNILQSLKCIC